MIESAALFVLGCYLLCYAIFDVVYVFAKIQLYRSFVSEAPYEREAPMPLADFAQLCANIVTFVIALGIIAFSRGIVALRDRLSSLRGPLHRK